MQRPWWMVALLSGLIGTPGQAQGTSDSSAHGLPAPPWRNKVLYGGGPSIGPPASDFSGATPPATWCLRATARTTGDYRGATASWTDMSVPWLHQVLSDQTDLGAGWRRVLGGAPQLSASDSITQVMDEDTCRALAATVNRDLLGWQVGPPPVVVLQARGYLIVFPSNASWGEFGLAVGMHKGEIRGVATW